MPGITGGALVGGALVPPPLTHCTGRAEGGGQSRRSWQLGRRRGARRGSERGSRIPGAARPAVCMPRNSQPPAHWPNLCLTPTHLLSGGIQLDWEPPAGLPILRPLVAASAGGAGALEAPAEGAGSEGQAHASAAGMELCCCRVQAVVHAITRPPAGPAHPTAASLFAAARPAASRPLPPAHPPVIPGGLLAGRALDVVGISHALLAWVGAAADVEAGVEPAARRRAWREAVERRRQVGRRQTGVAALGGSAGRRWRTTAASQASTRAELAP